MMNAVVMTASGAPDVLDYRQINKPEIAGPNELIIKIKAAGLNPVDTKVRQGYLPVNEFPAILGCDAAGVVESTGEQVSEFTPGDEVFYFHGGLGTAPGNYAEYAAVHEKYVVKKPGSLNFIEAAAVPLVLLTAWESLHDRACIKEGQTVLIHAGAGGVGHVAIQLAKLAGARVLTTVGSEEKADFVRQLGADEAIFYKNTDFVSEVMRLTDNLGADIVMDNIGGPLFQASFASVRHYGDLVSLLLPADDVDWSTARTRNLRISLELMLTPFLLDIRDRQARQREILQESVRLIDSGLLKIHVSKTFSLEQAAEAHAELEAGSTTGKLVFGLSD